MSNTKKKIIQRGGKKFRMAEDEIQIVKTAENVLDTDIEKRDIDRKFSSRKREMVEVMGDKTKQEVVVPGSGERVTVFKRTRVRYNQDILRKVARILGSTKMRELFSTDTIYKPKNSELDLFMGKQYGPNSMETKAQKLIRDAMSISSSDCMRTSAAEMTDCVECGAKMKAADKIWKLRICTKCEKIYDWNAIKGDKEFRVKTFNNKRSFRYRQAYKIAD